MARGYGYADLATNRQATPTSLFRIASISKPITAVAVMQLVERGKLRLEDRVFDILKYEPHLEKDTTFDERYHNITVEHLLQHRGGWNREVSFDAMFQSIRFAKALDVPPPAQPQHVICCMLGLPLDFNPGERYAYSNFGYCLLGRIIEMVSQQSYESHVKEHVFAPLGIKSARLGKTRPDGEPSGDEVRYYSPEVSASVFADSLNTMVPSAYGGWYLEAMDAHGGWLASAVDLARFACAFDDRADCPLLREDSIARMFAPPNGLSNNNEVPGDNSYYSCGWLNRPAGGNGEINSWHTGSLPGTATLLVRRHDGKNFVILFNARSSPEATHFGEAIDPRLNQAINRVSEWPAIDLFDTF
jgi:N-acyl-D-amino-acid deacylase